MAFKWFQNLKNEFKKMFKEPARTDGEGDSASFSESEVLDFDKLYAEQHPDDPVMPDEMRKELIGKVGVDVAYAKKLYAEQHPDDPQMPKSLEKIIPPGLFEQLRKRGSRGE